MQNVSENLKTQATRIEGEESPLLREVQSSIRSAAAHYEAGDPSTALRYAGNAVSDLISEIIQIRSRLSGGSGA